MFNLDPSFSKIIKSSFPNLDPNFFKFGQNSSSDDSSVIKHVIDSPYSNSIWVYSACNAIAGNLSQLPKRLD